MSVRRTWAGAFAVATLGVATAGGAAPDASSAAPLVAPIHATCDGHSLSDWDRWLRDRGIVDPRYERAISDVTPLRNNLPETVRMLRRGLEACDPLAADLVRELGMKELVSPLRELLESGNVTAPLVPISRAAGLLRSGVLEALLALDPGRDYAPAFIALFSYREESTRTRAVFAARLLPLAKVKAPLIERIRIDDAERVRHVAAESVLTLAGIHPTNPEDHGPLVAALQDRKGGPRAAQILEGMLAERARNPCAPPVRPRRAHVKGVPVGDQVLAIAFDVAEGGREMNAQLVVFVELPEEGPRPKPFDTELFRDTSDIVLATSARNIRVHYERAAGMVSVEGIEGPRAPNNVAVVSLRKKVPALRWRGSVPLRGPKLAGIAETIWSQISDRSKTDLRGERK